MSVTEQQTPLPTPPTGHDQTIVEQTFNPENKHFEPILLALPRNATIASGVLAAPTVLLAVAAGVPVWIYYITLANTSGAAETCVITEPGVLTTLTVEVPANQTVILPSTPNAPIFMSRPAAAGNITVYSDVLGAVTVTIAYVTK